MQQRYAEAASAYEKASAQNPRDTDLKVSWAAALLNLPETAGAQRARDLLLDVTKTNPKASWPLYLLARAQRLLDDLDGAEGTARQILAINPGSTSGAHALAQVFESRRQYAKIVETLEPIVAKTEKGRDADAALLLTHLGVAYLELGRGQDAVGAFDRAIQTNPGDGALKTYRAQALVLAKNYDLAITLVRELRAARPDDLRLARLEADALRGQGKFDAGVAVLRSLADATGAGPIAVQVLSEFLASDHRYADAAALLKTALAKFPKDLSVQFQYGAMLERLKKYDEAERVLRLVIAADANHAPALNNLGYTLIARGQRVPEALALIKRAVKLDPYNGSYLDSLGWAHFKLNQLDLAEASLRTAAGQLAGDSVVQDHFGDVLAARGRLAEAVEAWRRSLSGDGEVINRAKIERKIRDLQSRVGKQ
jgi:tetratricopeptide (TPR) repeat protein